MINTCSVTGRKFRMTQHNYNHGTKERKIAELKDNRLQVLKGMCNYGSILSLANSMYIIDTSIVERL